MSLQARALVSHPDRVFSSSNAHLPPSLCSFELGRSSSAPTVSLRAHLPLGPCLFELERSPPPRPHPFELERSSSTPTMSLRAWALVTHPDRVCSSPSACSLACGQIAKEDHEERATREQQIYSFPCNYLKPILCIDSTTGKRLVKRGKNKVSVLYRTVQR